ncbi:hypothetical protein ScalyP_jg11341 [Parmales sp. scaly parma]|nr:hypothetical protein ScalyP_jg11341 [Parmales sp. scaly parma]
MTLMVALLLLTLSCVEGFVLSQRSATSLQQFRSASCFSFSSCIPIPPLFNSSPESGSDGNVPSDLEEAEEKEEENLLQKIKSLGPAGILSYMVWELAFWGVGGVGAIALYVILNGHFPDLADKTDDAKLGGEAFAFINLARFAIPIRLGLAISTAPWVDMNIIKSDLNPFNENAGGRDASKVTVNDGDNINVNDNKD